MIINKTTNETRYINSNDIVPIGWQYGNIQKGIKRPENVKQKISQALKGKPMTDNAKKLLSNAAKQYKWYTDGNISVRIKDGDDIPSGFKRGRTILKDKK